MALALRHSGLSEFISTKWHVSLNSVAASFRSHAVRRQLTAFGILVVFVAFLLTYWYAFQFIEKFLTQHFLWVIRRLFQF